MAEEFEHVNPSNRILEILRDGDNYGTVEFAGEEREVAFGSYGNKKAAAGGRDPMAKEAGFPEMLYAGLIPFPTRLPYEEVLAHLSMTEQLSLNERVMKLLPKQMRASIEQQEAALSENGEAPESTVGKSRPTPEKP